jgi:hypothetical protein
MLRWSLRGLRTELRFAPAGVRHGADPVCSLEEVRGLRLFICAPESTQLDGSDEACLSLVVGEDGDTHGLFGGFPADELRKLADDMHRRLTAFQHERGTMSPLDPLSVVETTEDEAAKLMHTRPPRGGFRLFTSLGFRLLLNRWAATAWCLAMLAGLYASGRLAGAAGLNGLFLLGHGLVGFMHVALLVALWSPQKPAVAAEKPG